MTEKLLLVDFENVQQIDASRLDDNFHIMVFVGASQKNIPIELVRNLQRFGNRVVWQKVEGNGSNALDFFIACQLGRVLERSPRLHCVVLSKDKGFEPLLQHLSRNGLKCKRINSIFELDLKDVPAGDPNYDRAVEILGKSHKRTRPRRRKTLCGTIASIFQNKIDQRNIDRIIDMLFANKMIAESNNAIIYYF